MPRNDPFPMQSEAAQQMAASVVQGDTTNNWNRMATDNNDNMEDDAVLVQEPQLADDIGLVGDTDMDDPPKDSRNPDATDSFLDRPIWESRATSGLSKLGVSMRRTLESIGTKLYGRNMALSEVWRTLNLAATFFFMIGGYWLLRSLKDPILSALCGVQYIPIAKMLSVVVILMVVSIYNRLLDSNLYRHQLFYIFGTFYFGFFSVIALLLWHPTIGLANEEPSPYRILGFVSYCGIESFGSVMVALFWSFSNSNISLETAKASYGIMVATGQVGSILGPSLVNVLAPKYGPAFCYVIGAFCMLGLQVPMYLYVRNYPPADVVAAETESTNEPAKPKPKKSPAGVLEGLVLFYKHHYVKGIFAISCLFMVEVTIVDFTMKVLAQQYFSEEFPCQVGMSCYGTGGTSQDATAAFTAFMGFFGQATNILSFLLSLLGTSAVIRYLGLRLSLLLFPSLCLIVIIIVRLHPTLYTVFGAMMALKACSYALNNPTKELLYQPTSASVRYKAKSWIDTFGARGSKALGSTVTFAFSDSATHLVANGSLVGMAVASFLIWNATFMGKKFDEYTSTGYIVGGEDLGDDDPNVELIVQQGDPSKVRDTSCAIQDDDEIGREEEGQSDDSHQGDDDETPVIEKV